MHVGAAEAMTDVADGTVDLAVLQVALEQGTARENKVRVYGVTSRRPSENLPGAPSLSETRELAGLDVESWMGLLGPACLPPEVVARLSKELSSVLADAEVQRTPPAGPPAAALAGLDAVAAATRDAGVRCLLARVCNDDGSRHAKGLRQAEAFLDSGSELLHPSTGMRRRCYGRSRSGAWPRPPSTRSMRWACRLRSDSHCIPLHPPRRRPG